jgi:hypothetical protein
VGLLGFLNHWWNLPFLVMLGLVGVFFILQVIGIAGHGADADADHDLDADADHDVDADHDADADADHDGEGVGWGEILAFFGVGRVPFMVIWVTLFIFSGFSGIFLNSLLFVHAQGYAGWFFGIVLGLSLLIGLAAVKLFSKLAAKLVDTGGRGSTKKHELTGRVGVVASVEVDARHGEIRVHDDHGNEILIHGCTQGGEAPIMRGGKVVLVDFDAQRELFWVTACPDEERKV